MRINIALTKENIKILQNIKEVNPTISFKVSMKDKLIHVDFTKLEIRYKDYADIYDIFIEDIKTALLEVSTPYKIHKSDGIYVIEEVQEKKILLTLNLENTVVLEELKEKYPNKTQIDILNELIMVGYYNMKGN